MAQEKFDLTVIGGGPGGYVAAIRAAQLGLRTALIEREHLGGICLNWGCIPTKALLRSAEIFDHFKHAGDFGLEVQGASFDLQKIVARSRGVAAQLNAGVKHLLKKNKVQVFEGSGRLAGSGTIRLEQKDGVSEIQSTHIILATGARARAMAPVEPDGRLVWSYKEAMTPERMPKSLLIVGSGAIGIEFASFYRSLGAEVTVVEVRDRVLPVEDAEVSAFAHKAFERQGMKLLTSSSVVSLQKQADSVIAVIDTKGTTTEIRADRVIAAVGIVGNVENLGLEGTGVQVENTHIVTDAWCQTGEPGVYAIGDVAGAPWLAHKASHEGILCVERIAGVDGIHPLDKTRIPGCTYSRPQIASIGLTEAQAKERGYELKVGRFPFMGNGKAIALGEPEGFIKTVFDAKTGELLGAHMVGAEVTELIQGFSIGKTLETTEAELMHTVFPHPTLSEMLHEATLAAYGRAIHT
ncbi:dihydrolipoyl dehydrogenase [Aromatoleum anaerobium]|uniref:Dihydrolipoyl dehydrogenase n=1 Tax=Aromatoleum anaerobium TaxID=182180 RepID=A0N0U5_9RHOO|nr:dihydrolipoyl dehydrogenase [Aromatoleum anaerobium]ABK58623.1 putative dehydrogenase E3 component [Aromatoleum anaerobium]MCK0505378.1 dihydrolipoyl dehydrogenase [Aromatoleum anaerobium]